MAARSKDSLLRAAAAVSTEHGAGTPSTTPGAAEETAAAVAHDDEVDEDGGEVDDGLELPVEPGVGTPARSPLAVMSEAQIEELLMNPGQLSPELVKRLQSLLDAASGAATTGRTGTGSGSTGTKVPTTGLTVTDLLGGDR